MIATLFNIQKFSLHDGPGLRTVVFFKGCPLICPWCSNPESQDPQLEVTWDAQACQGCTHCISHAKAQNIHRINGRIVVDGYDQTEDYRTLCPNHAFSVEGYRMEIQTIVQEILKDHLFYLESGGGVTFSGGEVLMQADVAIELAKQLKAHQIHIALETTGYGSTLLFTQLIDEVDVLLYDLKHYDDSIHKAVIGVSNQLILENLRLAFEKNKDIVIRIPVIPDFNDDLSDAHGFARLLSAYPVRTVQLLPFHQLGEHKYTALNRPYLMRDKKALYPDDLKAYQAVIESYGYTCLL